NTRPRDATRAAGSATRAPERATRAPENATRAPGSATRAPENATRALWETPVDRRGALRLEEFVGTAERARAEESVVGRQRARVHRLDAPLGPDQRLEFARVAAPQDRHQRLLPRGQRTDRLLGDLLPALALMRVRLPRLHRERPVQQQHALPGPRRQVPVGRHRMPEVLAVLLVDVD